MNGTCADMHVTTLLDRLVIVRVKSLQDYVMTGAILSFKTIECLPFR